MQIYAGKQVKAIDLLQVGSESKLLSVLDEANLSDIAEHLFNPIN